MNAVQVKEKVTITIFSQKLAGYLMYNGFTLKYMKPDNKRENKNVFFFTDSEKLQKAMGNYTRLRSCKKK